MDEEFVLNPGELLCPECKGEGHRFVFVKTGYNVDKRKSYCNTCGGTKKIDWIQNITKEKKPFKSARGFPGLEGMDLVWGSNANIKEAEPFDPSKFSQEEVSKIYHQIVENLSRD